MNAKGQLLKALRGKVPGLRTLSRGLALVTKVKKGFPQEGCLELRSEGHMGNEPVQCGRAWVPGEALCGEGGIQSCGACSTEKGNVGRAEKWRGPCGHGEGFVLSLGDMGVTGHDQTKRGELWTARTWVGG